MRFLSLLVSVRLERKWNTHGWGGFFKCMKGEGRIQLFHVWGSTWSFHLLQRHFTGHYKVMQQYELLRNSDWNVTHRIIDVNVVVLQSHDSFRSFHVESIEVCFDIDRAVQTIKQQEQSIYTALCRHNKKIINLPIKILLCCLIRCMSPTNTFPSPSCCIVCSQHCLQSACDVARHNDRD